jgi:hypothetical protein
MSIDIAFQGSLFTSDFLTSAIAENPDWRAVSDADVKALSADLKAIFNAFPRDQKPNESRTEEDLIWPILKRLGWTLPTDCYLPMKRQSD